MFDSFVRKRLFKELNKIKSGSLKVTFPKGDTHLFNGTEAGINADIQLKDWRVIANLGNKGDVGFASDYRDGYWDCSNLEALLSFGLANEKIFHSYGHGNFVFKQLSKLLYLTQRNSLKGSKKNIQAHYDLGNEFYKLWLDPSMTYSSAIFETEAQEITSAQHNKYDRLLSKITQKNANILEVGCGWGGFAERAVLQGHTVKGITLSNEQADFAQQRLQNSSAQIVIEDYRKQSGQYDYIVSIEMFEAVGMRYWPVYFKKMRQLLKPGGKLLIQTITIDDKSFKQYTRSADMIRTFIFPGGMLPSEKVLQHQFKSIGLKCDNIYRFGHDYAQTLRYWLKKFDENYTKIRQMGFDDGFIKLWRFYLAACSAGFMANKINVIQMEITHA